MPALLVKTESAEELYQQRLERYTTAMHNGMPDRVPIRPLTAEIAASYAGYTCQQVTFDYKLAFDAVFRCARDFDWDAAVPHLLQSWTGFSEAIGLRYYSVPGLQLDQELPCQYREPSEQDAFMKRDEYDELIEDPVRFLYEVWLPRVSTELRPRDKPACYRHNLSLVKGGMALLRYLEASVSHVERTRMECGVAPAFRGILRAPLDVLADKLRGYVGLAFDLEDIPETVVRACHALMPHLGYIALQLADSSRQVPVPVWMDRGCTPLISKDSFDWIYWPTLRPILETLWSQGHQSLLYARGNWDGHLESFTTLPARSAIFHLDRTDPVTAHRVLGERLALSGGVPYPLLAMHPPEDVRAHCRMLIETIGSNGGYVMDASWIIRNDIPIENLYAMTSATREYGIYRSLSSGSPVAQSRVVAAEALGAPKVKPGVCRPFEERLRKLSELTGDRELVRDVWDDLEGLAYAYIWHVLLSF